MGIYICINLSLYSFCIILVLFLVKKEIIIIGEKVVKGDYREMR